MTGDDYALKDDTCIRTSVRVSVCMLLVAAFHYSKKQRGELAAKTKDKIRQATRRTPAVRAAGAHMGTQSHAANAVIGSDSATESARV